MSNTARSAAALSIEASGATRSRLITKQPTCASVLRQIGQLSQERAARCGPVVNSKCQQDCPELVQEWTQETPIISKRSSPTTDGWWPSVEPVEESEVSGRWQRRYSMPDDGSVLSSSRRPVVVAGRTWHQDVTNGVSVWSGYNKPAVVVGSTQSPQTYRREEVSAP